MAEQNDFEEILEKYANKSTLNRAESISNECVRIIKLDKEVGFIEAEIQGNQLIPYKLNFKISQKTI